MHWHSSSVVTLFPKDVQQISKTIIELATELHTHINENNRQGTEMTDRKDQTYVHFHDLNMDTLQHAINRAQTSKHFQNVSCSSLLAKAPQIAATSLAAADTLLQVNNLSLGIFFEYWSSPTSGLNGHSA